MQSRTHCLVLALIWGLAVLVTTPSSAAGLGAVQLSTEATEYDVDVSSDGAGNFVAVWTSIAASYRTENAHV